jgi:starch synthase (maltosyl-transferring)
MALPRMVPAPSEHLLRFVADRLRVQLMLPEGVGAGVRGFLRTNLTRARVARHEVVMQAGLRAEHALTFAGASWRDIPLTPSDGGFSIDLPLLEVGHFHAKAYCVDAQGKQLWPEGDDLGISVQPNDLRSANTIYCAFPRTFGAPEETRIPAGLEDAVKKLDERHFTVIPPSGTLRGLRRVLPHIFDRLGCRILHLLPIGPVPTTYARMGRYGSPYAQLDVIGIDPALVEFDKRTNAVDQFRELSDAVHLRDGLVVLDIVLNHTGWGSRLFDLHPEWFRRDADGNFHSPGAWGVVWADLVELDQAHSELWDELAQSLITWCRRGVDGFRCDAGYMVPLPAWQYVVARVRELFPDCLFLLEGLGGAWEATETLLTDGGMQWAYSELFQCYEPMHVAHYLDHAIQHSRRIGSLVHYSETHDNDRLAEKGMRWSRMRNHLCALTSTSGGFGFSAGVEWLCKDKFLVHDARPLGFGNEPNLLNELGRLNKLLDQHPCFFDGAELERVSPDDAHVLALSRVSQEGLDQCLVLVNLDVEKPRSLSLPATVFAAGGEKRVDLLGQQPPLAEPIEGGRVRLVLEPGQSYCLASEAVPRGLSGEPYRAARAQAAFAYAALGETVPHEAIGDADFRALARLVADDAAGFLGALSALDLAELRADLVQALQRARARALYPRVISWSPSDARRVTLLPPDHWLLVHDTQPFALHVLEGKEERNLRSTPVSDGHVAAVPPARGDRELDIALTFDRYGDTEPTVHGSVRRLARVPEVAAEKSARVEPSSVLLLTNGRGAMARLRADFGSVESKYDCLLAANLHPEVPTDRHVLVKRARVWANADGFITQLNGQNLTAVSSGSTACWTFAANAGDGRQVGVRIAIELLAGRNTVVMRCERVPSEGLDLPADRSVRLTVRFGLEDRSFHCETRADEPLERHFDESTQALAERAGFLFAPAPDRRLTVTSDRGAYHTQPEWTRELVHAEESSRGLFDRGDAFSPGWFDLPLAPGAPVTLLLNADADEPAHGLVTASTLPVEQTRDFEQTLRNAASAFLVRRGKGLTVIAGYPWFLDWGRDTLIAVRGLIAAGYVDEARQIILTFAAMEEGGTLPNVLLGEGAANRESSDAPLWLGLACEELSRALGNELYELPVDGKRSLLDVLESIAHHMLHGTSHGVYVDDASGLVFSPPHYTWMDTNHPAGTPREGYPIELSVMWIRLLRQLATLGRGTLARPYRELAERTRASLDSYYWPERGFFGDTLHGPHGTSAAQARLDDHLRPNHLLAVSLGVIDGERARATVQAVTRHLLVPGALRTLAPLPVSFALPIVGKDGQLLNDPRNPYWGRYEGDEDTRRKPAYHNGTAWPWWLGMYAEALALAWSPDSAAVAAAKAVLGSSARLLREGCLGQLPEILDGDGPHQQRGCDAQAWSVTETLRAWLALDKREHELRHGRVTSPSSRP